MPVRVSEASVNALEDGTFEKAMDELEAKARDEAGAKHADALAINQITIGLTRYMLPHLRDAIKGVKARLDAGEISDKAFCLGIENGLASLAGNIVYTGCELAFVAPHDHLSVIRTHERLSEIKLEQAKQMLSDAVERATGKDTEECGCPNRTADREKAAAEPVVDEAAAAPHTDSAAAVHAAMHV